MATEAEPAPWTKAWDPDVDYVVIKVHGDQGVIKEFFIRRAMAELAFPVVAALPDKTGTTDFDLMGGFAPGDVETLLRVVDPRVACTLSPEIITSTAKLAHFLGAEATLDGYSLFLNSDSLAGDSGFNKYKHYKKISDAVRALEGTWMSKAAPEWSDRVLDVMIKSIFKDAGYAPKLRADLFTDLKPSTILLLTNRFLSLCHEKLEFRSLDKFVPGDYAYNAFI